MPLKAPPRDVGQSGKASQPKDRGGSEVMGLRFGGPNLARDQFRGPLADSKRTDSPTIRSRIGDAAPPYGRRTGRRNVASGRPNGPDGSKLFGAWVCRWFHLQIFNENFFLISRQKNLKAKKTREESRAAEWRGDPWALIKFLSSHSGLLIRSQSDRWLDWKNCR